MTRTGPRATTGVLPAAPGVYRFRDGQGRVLYLGRAVELRRRVESYWGALSDRRHLRRMVPRIATVEAVVCDSAHEAAWLERNLLEHRKPYWNRSRGGQEVPVWIRLDPTGLSVVHEHERTAAGSLFGPYLGGLQVRLAVSALDRILPVAYTADRLGGSARDLARVRGIAATDRAGLTRAVTAVLDRDPSTVESARTELARRRDAAAVALAFELAARIQAEIEALDWVTSVQHVTSDTTGHVDICGWAEGVAVAFELRGGRLRTWTERLCPEPPIDRLAATPVQWRPYAERAATLAAQLRQAAPS